ncbi:MAG: galactose-1-phosphate uridylyltransferase [Acidimicrobiales bacterium]
MSQLRLDPLTGRWVVVSTNRSGRIGSYRAGKPVPGDDGRPCPFCPGNEEETLPALVTYGPGGDWLVRVVPNRYPAFDDPGGMRVDHLGPVFTQAEARGIHEVLIFSPAHAASLADLADDQLDLVMRAIQDRVVEHASVIGIRYSQVIVNSGRDAGASVEHPHAQLLGMPFVPRELADEQAGFARFEDDCLLCTTVASEEGQGHRMVSSDDDVSVFCPFWSSSPYEMLIVPRRHGPHMHVAPATDVRSVGRAIRAALGGLRERVGEVDYNLVFHSAPYRAAGTFHWHVHLIPKLTTPAGFEFGTGVMVNVVAPEAAANDLRNAESVAVVGPSE